MASSGSSKAVSSSGSSPAAQLASRSGTTKEGRRLERETRRRGIPTGFGRRELRTTQSGRRWRRCGRQQSHGQGPGQGDSRATSVSSSGQRCGRGGGGAGLGGGAERVPAAGQDQAERVAARVGILGWEREREREKCAKERAPRVYKRGLCQRLCCRHRSNATCQPKAVDIATSHFFGFSLFLFCFFYYTYVHTIHVYECSQKTQSILKRSCRSIVFLFFFSLGSFPRGGSSPL